MTKNKKPGSVWVALALMGVTIGAVMAALLIFLAAARSAEILSRPEAGETALLLLKRCRNWTLTVLAAAAGGTLIGAASGGMLLGYVWTHSFSLPLVRMTAVILALAALCPGGLAGWICFDMELPALCLQAGADLAQIETETLEWASVWIYGQTPGVLPDSPYRGEPMMLLQAADDSKVPQEHYFYLPDGLDFQLEGPLYQWYMPARWNWENCTQYRVAYTSHFHLVAEIQPAALPSGPKPEPVLRGGITHEEKTNSAGIPAAGRRCPGAGPGA